MPSAVIPPTFISWLVFVLINPQKKPPLSEKRILRNVWMTIHWTFCVFESRFWCRQLENVPHNFSPFFVLGGISSKVHWQCLFLWNKIRKSFRSFFIFDFKQFHIHPATFLMSIFFRFGFINLPIQELQFCFDISMKMPVNISDGHLSYESGS